MHDKSTLLLLIVIQENHYISSSTGGEFWQTLLGNYKWSIHNCVCVCVCTWIHTMTFSVRFSISRYIPLTVRDNFFILCLTLCHCISCPCCHRNRLWKGQEWKKHTTEAKKEEGKHMVKIKAPPPPPPPLTEKYHIFAQLLSTIFWPTMPLNWLHLSAHSWSYIDSRLSVNSSSWCTFPPSPAAELTVLFLWQLYCSALHIHSDDYGFSWVREHVVYLCDHDENKLLER